MAFKIIKKKDFTFDQDGTQTSGTHYTIAHKGRVFGVSSLRFDEGDLKPAEDGKTLSIEGALEIKAEQVADQITGEIRTFYSLYPKLDLQLAAL